jgi:hypothetical protein
MVTHTAKTKGQHVDERFIKPLREKSFDNTDTMFEARPLRN